MGAGAVFFAAAFFTAVLSDDLLGLLELLQVRGEIAIVGRRGKQRLWDLAERWYPPETERVSLAEAQRAFQEQRWRAAGVDPTVVELGTGCGALAISLAAALLLLGLASWAARPRRH